MDSSSNGSAGSGTVIIEHHNGLATETITPITIRYALKNRRTGLDSVGHSCILGSPNDPARGGYVFRLDTGFARDTAATSVFRKALRDWRCFTGVNFSIGPDTNIREIATDQVNAVFWDTLGPGILGTTDVDVRYCKDDSIDRIYYHTLGIDIAFSNEANFHIDTSTFPGPTEIDFYSVALHELGHAHLLMHVSEEGNLMHYSISPGMGTRTIDLDSEEGANRVLDSSAVDHTPGCHDPMVRIDIKECDKLNSSLGHVNRIPTLVMYPIPARDEIIVQADWGGASQCL